MFLVRKYSVWLSLNLYLLLTATWISAMRSGIIKYACMQPETHSMHITRRLVSSTWTPTCIAILIIIMWLSSMAMNLDMKYGSRFWSNLRERVYSTKSYIWLPLAALAVWFAFKEDLLTLLSILTWIGFIGFLSSCSLLLMKKRSSYQPGVTVIQDKPSD